jgi:hypothetical protein
VEDGKVQEGGGGVHRPLTYNWPSIFYTGAQQGNLMSAACLHTCGTCCTAVNLH